MKKILIISVFLAPLFSFASIDTNLKYGMKTTEVSELQDFLTTKGLMNQSTGFFGLVTLKAVQAYQTSEGIQSTGYVGNLTRGAINKELDLAVGASNEAELAETGTTTTPLSACKSGDMFNIFTGKSCTENTQAAIQNTITTAVNNAVTQALANQHTSVGTQTVSNTQTSGSVQQATTTTVAPIYVSPTEYFSPDSINPPTSTVPSGNNITVLAIVVGSYNATSTLDTFKVNLNPIGTGNVSNAYLYTTVWNGYTSSKVELGSTTLVNGIATFSGLNQNIIPKNANYPYSITIDATGPITVTPKMLSSDQILRGQNGEVATVAQYDVIGNQITVTN